MYLVLDHWIHYTLQMVWWIPYQVPIGVCTPLLGGMHLWIPLGCHVSGVGSLDTLHTTDGLMDTIPDTYRYGPGDVHHIWWML